MPRPSLLALPTTRAFLACSPMTIRLRPQTYISATKGLKRFSAVPKILNEPLAQVDDEVAGIIQLEKERQRDSINLIPSENFTSRAVMEALGSPMQNKYSEGYPGARYYGGNEHIDAVERLCQKRALEAYDLDPSEWGVNVQALSGSPANFYVYSALLGPHGRLMGLDLPHGGHLSHGYQTDTKKVSAVSSYFETLPYRCDESTGMIDYTALEKNANLFRPKVIIAGTSAYARNIDYARMKEISQGCKAYLMSDMAHISGLVAAGVVPSPFPYSDVVTTTTHKSLRGPRGALIFYRKGQRGMTKKGEPIMYDLESKINSAVFPGHQGGPHNHTITALAVALRQAKEPLFKEYQTQVLKNSKAMANKLEDLGYDLVTGGTDTHLILVDLRKKNIDGARVERILELVNIAANKNTVPGDTSALVPYGLRLGSPAMTSRGAEEIEFERMAALVDRAVHLTIRLNQQALKAETGGKRVRDFKRYVGEGEKDAEVKALREEVIDFSRQLGTVGYTLSV
ncbi:MAG: serine hydroxymethyltransferase-domain-containing protein [Piptocephalis tieghemiana]|nr:MAG: serine hydroxymethyltransferase-domain-containing protein [Piptocephalis tieghemiana]